MLNCPLAPKIGLANLNKESDCMSNLHLSEGRKCASEMSDLSFCSDSEVEVEGVSKSNNKAKHLSKFKKNYQENLDIRFIAIHSQKFVNCGKQEQELEIKHSKSYCFDWAHGKFKTTYLKKIFKPFEKTNNVEIIDESDGSLFSLDELDEKENNY